MHSVSTAQGRELTSQLPLLPTIASIGLIRPYLNKAEQEYREQSAIEQRITAK
jgi:hypothetical protein